MLLEEVWDVLATLVKSGRAIPIDQFVESVMHEMNQRATYASLW